MGWALIAILAIIIGLIQELLPIIGIAIIVGIVYAIFKGIANAIQEHKNARIASVTQEVNAIISRYSPSEIIFSRQAITYQVTLELLNQEVMDSVRRYKASLAETAALSNELDQRIKRILACHGCMTPDEKLAYLKRQSEELDKLKSESDDYHRHIENCKIQLLHEDSDKLFNIKKASLALLSSKKCISNTTSVKTFITDIKPSELSMFQFKCEPVIFLLDNFFFCLFSNVILVFDSNGVFSAALDPIALKVRVERETTKYSYDRNIDSDSKAVTYTEIRKRWLYACKDGSPDLRYNGNRQIEYPVEVNGFEYGRIIITIGAQAVEFYLSSSNALDMFERVPSIYCHECKHKHNPIPYFLNLMEIVSEDRVTIEYISGLYLSVAFNKNYFCKVITK